MQTARRMLLNDETQRLARPRDDALRFRRDSEVALGPVLLQIVGHRALRANVAEMDGFEPSMHVFARMLP